MSRSLLLVRRVTAGPLGWGGDPAWSQATPPAPAEAPEVEDGSPIMHIPRRHPTETHLLARGATGVVRVTGADSARRFLLRVYVEWVRTEGLASVSDWRLLSDGDDPRDIGDGEDFTTEAADLTDQRIAFRLTPIGDNLVEGSAVEIWAEVI